MPRLLRQAQKEAGNEVFQKESRCILIDANLHIKTFGKAFYHDNPNHFHHQLYPEIEIWKTKTDDGPERLKREGITIDYLHIDANHCFEQSLKDFSNYLPLMSENFIISLHDTGTYFSEHLDGCVPRTIAYLKKEMEPGGLYPGLEIIDFNNRFH